MKKVKTTLIVIFSIMLLFLMTFNNVLAAKLDMSVGEIKIELKKHNPISISVKDAKDASVKIDLNTKTYNSKTFLSSPESFEVKEIALASSINVEAELKKGNLTYHAVSENNRLSYSISQKGGKTSIVSYLFTGKNPVNKQVETSVRTSKAEKGTLIINHERKSLSLPSTRKRLSDALNISLTEAEEMIDEKGEMRVKYALDKTNGHLKKRTNSQNRVAGGGGMISGSGPISLNRLGPNSTFSLYLDGVKAMGKLMDPALAMKLLHPKTNRPIKGFNPTITLYDSESKPPKKNVVLIDAVPFNNEKGYYYFDFRNASWLVDFDELKSDTYKVHVDVGLNKKVKLECKITEDGKIVPYKS